MVAARLHQQFYSTRYEKCEVFSEPCICDGWSLGSKFKAKKLLSDPLMAGRTDKELWFTPPNGSAFAFEALWSMRFVTGRSFGNLYSCVAWWTKKYIDSLPSVIIAPSPLPSLRRGWENRARGSQEDPKPCFLNFNFFLIFVERTDY